MEDGRSLAAFSMIVWRRVAAGKPEHIVGYVSHYLQGAWSKKDDAFIVPEAGLYYLSLSYLRDAQPLPNETKRYTNEDTRIDIVVNGDLCTKQKSHAAAPGGGPRQLGAVSLIMHMDQGDKLWTRDWAQEEEHERRLEEIVFAGYRIGKP
tara:strand:+ start:394 stop:843 length:450 start_codon:yes stop_codon:yes gene_type:complete